MITKFWASLGDSFILASQKIIHQFYWHVFSGIQCNNFEKKLEIVTKYTAGV